MKKIIATVLVAVMALVMFSVAVSAENTLVIDFNTPEGQAAGTFFGNNCNYAEDAGTEGKIIARLVNLAPDGSDASAESEGGLFGNGIAVKFDAGADGEATIVLTLICPDHVNGAFNYRIYHSTNDADYVKEELDAVQDHVFFDYTIKVNIKKGENTIKFVQGVSPWGNGEGGNGWRVDIAKLVITLPEDSAPVDESEYHYVNASFDSFYVNDVLNFGEPDGAASDKLDARGRTVDGSDGSVSKFTLRGWIGFEEEIESFGYQINGKDPVYGDFKAATEDDVRGAGGENALRFQIEIDATQLKGTNNIVMVVKLANGAVVKIDDTLQATGPATPPNTSFTFVGVEDSQPATQPETQPETQPQTGDAEVAMIAVIAVLAIGAAVVFSKKRGF